jgi:phage tail sheath protein FI
MAQSYKTPGVYIVEKDAFPNSVVSVATAVPAFIGYTEKSTYKDTPLLLKPWRITSMTEFQNCFGHAPKPLFEIAAPSEVTPPTMLYRLYAAMQLFFQNGGGACYVISVGSHTEDIDPVKLKEAIAKLEKEQEPTLIVIPEAVCATTIALCADIQNAALMHCAKMKNRFTILDVYAGHKEPVECITPYRESLTNHLHLGAAYYPWLRTTVVASNDLSFKNFKDKAALKTLLAAEVPALPAPKAAEINAELAKLDNWDKLSPADQTTLHRTLMIVSPKYVQLLGKIQDILNLQPPSGAMAGIYTMIDNSIGVWKAPANVGINGVVAPQVSLTHDDQEDLNMPTNGRAINAIRSFVGEGTLVWGARTLDGNSQDWRYISVRRTMLMLEESVRLAAKAYVFEPNVSSTWVSLKSMIQSFLNGVWKQGGLAGLTPEAAYGVYVGLGETMTAQDILDGFLLITVKVAMVRPAEFIEITFQQKQQES